MELREHPGLLPVPQSPPAGDAAAVPQRGGQPFPGDAGGEDEENTRQGGPVGQPRSAALRPGRRSGKEGGESLPECLRDPWFCHTSSSADSAVLKPVLILQ